MRPEKAFSKLVPAFCLAFLLMINIFQGVQAGTNGQQLRIKNVCYAQSVRVIGYNQKGERKDISLSADQNKCVTLETRNWWWKGTVVVTANYPDTTYQRVITNVSAQQNSDWLDITIPSLSNITLRGYEWVKVNVRYGSFDNDPNNDFYSAVNRNYSNRPMDTSYYRTDCSGFVSYAWNLGRSYDTVALGKLTKDISYSTLQSDDIVNNKQSGQGGHVLIFLRWKDKNNNEFWAYEESYGQGTVVSTIRLVVNSSGTITSLQKLYGSYFNTYGNGPWYAERFLFPQLIR